MINTSILFIDKNRSAFTEIRTSQNGPRTGHKFPIKAEALVVLPNSGKHHLIISFPFSEREMKGNETTSRDVVWIGLQA